ncbi:hypothetical protein IGJ02_002626 [Enterococcus sp. DIV0724b]|uniref:tyrosine-type recombinase/integrase n=1 Tax=Enterococcus sp. DIV0724b TaxID=2774694 RepID=UPI003D2FC051
MPRKGENIYQRKDGRWEGRYRKARDSQGKLVYGSVYGKKYMEVKLKLEQIKAQYSSQKAYSKLFSGTTTEWLNYWLDHLVIGQVKKSTFASYKTKLNNHIVPYIGHKKLSLLQKKDILELLFYLGDKGLSTTTIHNTLTIFKGALTKAVVEKALVENPFDGVVFPPIKKKAITILSLEQQKKLESIELQKKECSPIIIALYTGLRIGEISGLTWADIDLDNRIIHVVRTVQRISVTGKTAKTEILFDLPKSKQSLRKIPIAQNLYTYLSQKKEATQGSFVINNHNSYAEPRLINYHFRRAIKQAEITGIHFHALRHTFATRCIENGIDIATLSHLLGHQSIKLTLDTYAGSLWETREQAMSVIDAQLNLAE